MFVAGAFAAVVAAAIVGLGRISGANINPAVTLALAVRDRKWKGDVPAYLAAQLAGGVAAGLLLLAIMRPDAATGHLGSTALAPGVSAPSGFVLEASGTFVLAFSALQASRVVPRWPGQAALVGGVLFVLIVILAPLTGASFNPARSLGPALASGFLANLSVFFAGPLVGGAAAGAVVATLSSRR